MPGVRAEIEQQQTFDRTWQSHAGVLDARIAAVVGARRAFARRELGRVGASIIPGRPRGGL